MVIYRPPFNITSNILNDLSSITKLIGQYEGLLSPVPQAKLRKSNKIKTIQSSLAIEGNTLTVDQVTDILENKKVVGPKKDILEVKNAAQLYDQIDRFIPHAEKDFLKAHKILMADLIDNAGKYRSNSVGVLKGSKVSHVAPPYGQVPQLMARVFDFIKMDKQTHPIIKACVVHYEIEFIHPFMDGNGRMGRLWQHLLLLKFHKLFSYVPVETIIRNRQQKYYESLELSDKEGESTRFIEFSVASVLESLTQFLVEIKPEPVLPSDRIKLAQEFFGKKEFSRKDYINFFKTLSTATASRDLKYGVSNKVLKISGDKSQARYLFKK